MNAREKRKSFLKSLDAFPKVEESLTAPTETGGLLSVIIMAVMAILIFSEIYEWRKLRYEYEFLVDQTPSSGQLNVNIDMTIAMECKYMRIDVRDVSGTALSVGNSLHPKPVTFHVRGVTDFSRHYDQRKNSQDSHRPEKDNSWGWSTESTSGPLDGCHISGSFPIEKVKGTFHITALGHGYMGVHTPHEKVNFTHRFDSLSFGMHYPGLVNPMDKTYLQAATSKFHV
jgi:endoplasmic reticulum-Golgi intermediate compartment protein 2